MYWLRSGLGDGLPHPQGLPTVAVQSLSLPRLNELATITRAIYRWQVAEVTYASLSSGNTRKQIVPHALVDNGQRWLVRANLVSLPGRPPIPLELCQFTRRLATENSLRGEKSVANELLLKLGLRVSPCTSPPFPATCRSWSGAAGGRRCSAATDRHQPRIGAWHSTCCSPHPLLPSTRRSKEEGWIHTHFCLLSPGPSFWSFW
jgi:hypothetical protein